jgi:AcrR family transcriptional regulator
MAQGTTDRRVRRTRQAIREAFLSLVLDRGYDNVGVDDIAERADVARATFYAHYATKDVLLEVLFGEIIGELVDQVAHTGPDQPRVVQVRTVGRLYAHAEELRDLYLVVLRGAGQGRARLAYLDTIAEGAKRTFTRRLQLTGSAPLVPLEALARAYAGAHVALLHAWLEEPHRPPADEAASTQTLLLTRGFGWALAIPEDFVLDLEPDDEAGATPPED